ncbi:sugar ABC transporter permease [Rhodobacteraceae bacterium N5(2021)]|uniref:Sugar ABC transporter permease n=1 Tax=Gymnodinialimonas phycosphaerae TaxID=2841589 RepID=A0A975YEF3_9RHOB|nr:sugar ABC transporter permease [Gymnodinialimonas phycosphaerae]MBY4893525.1 sugar ABC transporter permease [Gymnodinialimonas phycosphaerae]
MTRLSPYLFVLPACLILGLFVYWPIVYSVWLSVHRWDFLMPQPEFIGARNYVVMLTSGQFQNALWNTVLFTLISVPPTLGLALAVAVLVAPPTRPNRLLRSVYFMPTVMSAVAIGVIFDWMMNTEIGTFNRVLNALGLPAVRWLSDPDVALFSLAIVEVWKQFGYSVVIYAAALQAIPTALYEAARMDGARSWHQFRDVTFPLVMPTTFFLLILSVINGFQVYTFVEVMTQGGPARATEVILYYLIRVGFDGANVGLGSAVALFLFALLIGITVLKIVTIGRKVHYGYD